MPQADRVPSNPAPAPSELAPALPAMAGAKHQHAGRPAPLQVRAAMSQLFDGMGPAHSRESQRKTGSPAAGDAAPDDPSSRPATTVRLVIPSR